jgi:hypothetical protein
MGSVKKSTKTKEPRASDALAVGHVVSDGGKEVKVKRPRGRPALQLKEEDKKKMIAGIECGIPVERLLPLVGFQPSSGGWSRFLQRHPDFAREVELAKSRGEVDLVLNVRTGSQGWQGAAWLLERARGYVARASMEHTGRGGSTLTIAHQLLSSVAERER